MTAQAQYVYGNEAGSATEANRYVDRFRAQREQLQSQLEELETQAQAGQPGTLQKRLQLSQNISALNESISAAGIHAQQYLVAGDTASSSPISKYNSFDTQNISNPLSIKDPQTAEQRARQARLEYQLVQQTTFNTPDEKTAALNIAQKNIAQADQSVNYWAKINADTIVSPQAEQEADLASTRTATLAKTQSILQAGDATALQKQAAIDAAFAAERNFQDVRVVDTLAVDQDIVGEEPITDDDISLNVPTVNFDDPNVDPEENVVSDVSVIAPTKEPEPDFRVRIRAMPTSRDQVYGANSPENLMFPLWSTNGVLFPFTPVISYSHAVNYSQLTPTHSNTDYHIYTNTSAVQIQITAQFSAQNQQEAHYLLAVMHFFRTVTKMRFGESDELAGLPPPILLLSGYGTYMFNDLPVIINTATPELPNNVDYVQVEHQGTTTWVPSLTSFNITATVQQTPEQQRKFDWNQFASGALMRDKGWI